MNQISRIIGGRIAEMSQRAEPHPANNGRS